MKNDKNFISDLFYGYTGVGVLVGAAVGVNVGVLVGVGVGVGIGVPPRGHAVKNDIGVTLR